MLYGEFLEGTEAKDNEYNYQIYKELEIIYMNTDCTKQHIYDLGKKLVDNTWKTEEQKQVEREALEEIERLKQENEDYKKEIAWKNYLISTETDKEWQKSYRNNIRYYRERMKENRDRIKALKWVIA